MSHFYGVLEGSRGQATRCGTKRSGMQATAASWRGAVDVRLWHDEETGEDCYSVSLIPWHGHGRSQELSSGVLR